MHLDGETAAALRRLLTPPGPEDPYPDYARLRSAAPVLDPGFGTCFLTRYADCEAVLRSPDFAVQDPAWFDANMPGWRDSPARGCLYLGVQSRNPPDHTRLRRMVAGAFTPRRMAALRTRVGELVEELLDGMAARAAGGRPVDLMAELAFPLPVAVIGELLGVPAADRATFRGLTSAFLDVMDLFVTPGTLARADAAAVRLREFWRELISRRRRDGGSDLTAALARAADAGQAGEDELTALLMFLFSAGYGTTAALIGTLVAALLADPEQADLVRRDPACAAAAVEEALRHDSPGQIASRLAVRDARVGAAAIPAGRHVTLLLGAANRDPARFTDPDRFDLRRREGNPLSFGGGIHYCLGAPLSRMEAGEAVPRLLRRFPRLAPAGPPVRRLGIRMRIFTSLPVRPT